MPIAAGGREDLTRKLEKKLLRKKPKTLRELSTDLNVSVKKLTYPIAALVQEGKAEQHKGRPPAYTKAA